MDVVEQRASAAEHRAADAEAKVTAAVIEAAALRDAKVAAENTAATAQQSAKVLSDSMTLNRHQPAPSRFSTLCDSRVVMQSAKRKMCS